MTRFTVSLKHRLVLTQMSVVFVVLALFIAFMVLSDARTYRESVDAKLASMAAIIGHNCTSALDFHDESDGAETLASLSSEPKVSAAWILDGRGAVFASYSREGIAVPPPIAPSEDGREDDGSHLTVHHPIVRQDKAIGFVVLRYDLDRFATILLRSYPSAVVALLGGMGLALLLALGTQRAVSMPILHLVSAFRSIAERGDLSIRLPEQRSDEIGALYRGVNSMLVELQAREQERNQAQSALRQSEERYRTLVEQANSIILRWSRDGRITFLNEFGQRFFGYSEAEIVGRLVVGTIVPQAESGGRNLRPLMSEICSDPLRFERSLNENVRRNGERVWIAWTNRAVLDETGAITEVLSVGSDVTDRMRAEEEIRRLHADLQIHAVELEARVRERTAELAVAKDRAEAADRMKSAFLATMSHELRTPLNSIIGFTGLILQGLAGPLNPEQTKQLRMVKGSGQHLLALINDVLDISKIEAGQVEVACAPFDLRETIQTVIRTVLPLADKKQLRLVPQLGPEVGQMRSDRRRVEQVLLNLLSNAVKFTDHGEVRVNAHVRDESAVIRVTDTGIGIKPEDLDKLFQPFRQIDSGLTRQYEGTGLGLAICKRMVTMMGGTMEVDSQWGVGSTFQVILPVSPEGKP